MKVKDFIDVWRRRRSDATKSLNTKFVIDAINWGNNELGRMPGVGEVLYKFALTKTLRPRTKDGKDAKRWDLTDYSKTGDITRISMLQLYRSTTSTPEPIMLKFKDPDDFYSCNPMFVPTSRGMPKEMTYDTDGTTAWLAIDRPSSVPLIVDYRFSALPKIVTKVDDDMNISRTAFNTLLDYLDICYFMESMDYALTDPTWSNIDKAGQEIRQRVNKLAYQKPYVLR